MKVPVLLPKIFNYPLTYISSSTEVFKTGDFVEVPFGKNKEIGVVWSKIQITDKKIKLRKINKKINKISIDEKLIKFIDWFSVYNVVPKGMVLKMCLGDKKNILKIENKKNSQINIKKNKYSLNKEQKIAFNNLSKLGNKFNVSVLHGVTGSGKTLVYFELIKNILKKNKQVLVLLPEIFLTNQFQDRFLDFFGSIPSIWHSKITQKNKRRIWQGVIKNEIKLVIGARSSLLLPFKDLGLIIVDEEHDPSYKQEEGLIYNARDMAITRASIENFPITLVSSIPSLETFNHIKNKKYNYTKISKRFNDHPLPEKNITIFSSDYLKKKKESKEIFEKIKKNEINILIGTQMISKGFNFPKLNCIVVVDADFSGKGYDLRTTEKNIQLYNQLSGRAGRFSSKSIIVYQTITPSHETLKDLLKNNPEKFLENELIIRKENNLPPFKRLIAIIVSSSFKEYSFRGAQEVKKKLKTIRELEILGPVDSPIFKVKKMYRTRLLLRSKNEIFIQKKLIKILDNMNISSKIKLTVDVDPINFT